MVNAIEHLEELQKGIYSKIGDFTNESFKRYQEYDEEFTKNLLTSYESFVPKEWIDAARDFHKKDNEEMLRLKLPTKYENRLEYQMILDLADDIKKSAQEIKPTDDKTGTTLTLKELGMNITDTFFGTLPTGNVQALTIQCDDGYLIIFESEIFYFCYFLSKIIAWSFPYEKIGGTVSLVFNENSILNRLDNNKEILKRFGELIIAYALGGKNMAPRYSIEAPYYYAASELTQAMERFVMGHEYSHVLLRHKPMKNGRLDLIDIRDYYKKMFSWKQEYEADYWGMQLMFKAMESNGSNNLARNYASIEAFFCGFEVMKRAIAILIRGHDDWYWKGGKKENEESTHPPFQQRRGFTRKMIEQKYVEIYGAELLTMTKLIELIINNLWANVKPFLIDLHKQGFQAHPKWTVYDQL